MKIKFMFILNTEALKEPVYTADTESLIEGTLNIYLNENLFFHDPNINLVEFRNQLNEWLTKIKNGLRENMNYESITRNEDIINFLYKEDESWGIHSIWQNFESNEYIATDPLVESVQAFISELNNELNETNFDKSDKFFQ